MKKLTLLTVLLILPLPVSANPSPADYPIYSDNTRMAQEWINKMKNWKAEQHWTAPGEGINNALAELEWPDGSDDTPQSEKLLQFSCDGDCKSIGWRYD